MSVVDRLLAPNSTFQTKFFFLAKRFVPGESIASAIDAVRTLNDHGLTATLDFLGEDITTLDEAAKTRDAYLETLAAIERSGVRSNVSVKLTAFGLGLDPAYCRDAVAAVVARAASVPDPFVRIDMEGSAVTQATIDLFEGIYAEHKNAGIVLQAYLKRTPADVERAIALGARVRLCKGAYSEPPEIAIQDMPSIRRAYVRLAEALLQRGNYPAIATHDDRLIEAVQAFAHEHSLAKDAFEFQMLYGIRPDRQRQLARDGYNVRVYVPFGTHWAGYFFRRLAERKENVLFVARSLVSR